MNGRTDPVPQAANILGIYAILAALGLWIGIVFSISAVPASSTVELQTAHPPPASPASLRGGAAEVRLIFAGDVMQHAGQSEDDFAVSYAALTEIVSAADVSMANLEFPVHPSRAVGPESGSVVFNGSPDHIRALADAGFDVMVVANNHAFDQGAEGLSRTLRLVERQGMVAVGAAEDSDRSPIRVVEAKQLKIGIAAYTYGINPIVAGARDVEFPPREFPVKPLNLKDWTGRWREQGRAEFDAHVSMAREAGVEFLVAYCHWGEEWAFGPDENQQQAAHDLIDAGFDLVVGSHPHVLQPSEIYQGKLIAYSLGTLLSDFEEWQVRTAALLEVGLRVEAGRVQLVHFAYHPTLVNRRLPNHPVQLLDSRSRGVAQSAWQLSHQVLGEAVSDSP